MTGSSAEARTRGMTQLSSPPLGNSAVFTRQPRQCRDVGVNALDETNAELLGVQSQHVADALEGERPPIVARTDPALGFAEELSARIVLGSAVLAEAGDCVEEHGPEQAPLSERHPHTTALLELCR
jgi:hypothetical protein